MFCGKDDHDALSRGYEGVSWYANLVEHIYASMAKMEGATDESYSWYRERFARVGERVRDESGHAGHALDGPRRPGDVHRGGELVRRPGRGPVADAGPGRDDRARGHLRLAAPVRHRGHAEVRLTPAARRRTTAVARFAVPYGGGIRLRRELFQTTNPDDRAIAAPAIRGLSRPAAATGIATRL